MKRPIFFVHPITVFCASIVAGLASLFIFIQWHVEFQVSVFKLLERLNISHTTLEHKELWPLILVCTFSIGSFLLGLITIFIYYQKTNQLVRMQKNFIDNFTHELKTPVASIKLYLQTFMKHEPPKEMKKKFISYMLKDTERLANHIEQILQLGRLENKQEPYKTSKIKIIDFTKQFIKDNKHLYESLDIKIFARTPNPLKCYLNKTLFELLLQNLISNAKKYNNNKNPRLTIRFHERPRFIIITFKDNGIGITKEHLNSIFNKFYRASSSEIDSLADNNDLNSNRVSLQNTKGTGLGLYISKNIVKYHKGDIQVESKGINKGTLFTIQFKKTH